MGFDIAYALFIFNLGGLCTRLWRFYGLLFAIIVICYFTIEMWLVLDVWKASLSHSEDTQGIDFRQVFLDFFLEITLSLFV
jgi:hypothetical protein